MTNTIPPTGPAPGGLSTVGVEHECKWELAGDELHEADGLDRFFEGSVLSTALTPLRRPLTFVSSTVYIDDAARSLTRAGHTLGVVVNVASASHVCWLTLKQAVRRHAWRDGLELAERLTPAEVPQAINDEARLPVGHARRCRLVDGPLAPVAVATQRRVKSLARSADGVEVAYSLDLVTFRSPDAHCPPIGTYSCVEVEVNSSAPHALRLLGELADSMDQWLGRPRARLTKAQHALAAVERHTLMETAA
ncbi:hypothetical protein [Kitasatospora mediocidica]|uniref:hypothetical protein n=1 Tax=Kitasatospora mediocidica TaxID=58352 RepID=UPI0005636BA5|nr:hypothetical protein [Kitasatospora mediocidica]